MRVRVRVLVLVPAARAVTAKVLDGDLRVRERDLGAEREYVIEREDVPVTEDEHDTPSWFLHMPSLRVTDYRSWAEVAEWAVPLYEAAGRDPAIEKKAAELRNGNATAEVRALAAIRFVQDDVRYLGIENGEQVGRAECGCGVTTRRYFVVEGVPPGQV